VPVAVICCNSWRCAEVKRTLYFFMRASLS
jgi:hypothetical protein